MIGIDEKLEIDQDLAEVQAETQGRVIVDVGRYQRKKLSRPKALNLTSRYKTPTSVNVAKDIYKDRHIRQSVMFFMTYTINIIALRY